ncbi:hypothetical protein [Peristeroidobacter agariperforans]|uniref:hypothetical protein n=1 Tax=Peristeroidobacter agariperforans TaxID=268404 RepID=UPI001E45A108|nr:hypothetical protein [Peristeroidobacter agariperforans]
MKHMPLAFCAMNGSANCASHVQTARPHEHAEDPFGLQRPTDRDATTAAEDFADVVSELAEARLVATAGRQSVIEARQQGILTFCLTIDRHSASYLPAVLGKHHFAVLHRPEMLLSALIGWLRRLVHR